MAVLKTENLVKEFEGGFRLGPVNLTLTPGETLALVGKNGAGKSTFFQMITGNSDPTDGHIYFGEELLVPDKPELKRRIGYLPQHHDLPAWVTGRELISYAAKLYELKDPKVLARETLARWGAEEYAHKPIAACSHGMQKRIGLGLATMHEPDLLILDEPFSGLDLTHIKSLENLVKERATQKKVTILSTHITPYCARLATRVMMIANGQMEPLNTWTELDELQRALALENAFFKSSQSC
jgi:ABC-type multidrug transport system ATPase subunit